MGGSQLKTLSLFPQTSLNKLLETLGKAEPFFIRCIRSNAEKVSGSCLGEVTAKVWRLSGGGFLCCCGRLGTRKGLKEPSVHPGPRNGK